MIGKAEKTGVGAKSCTMEFSTIALFTLFSSFYNVLALSPKGKTCWRYRCNPLNLNYRCFVFFVFFLWWFRVSVTTSWLLAGVCLLQVDEGPCRGEIERYYYNTITQKCEIFYYGGCRGNANNFKSYQECQKTCFRIPSKSSV